MASKGYIKGYIKHNHDTKTPKGVENGVEI